jgi:hypothetical protein
MPTTRTLMVIAMCCPRPSIRALLLAPVFALISAAPLVGQAGQASRSVAPTAVPRRVAAASLAGAIRLDGRLDDPAWAVATPATDFTQSWPSPGEAASFRTEARVLLGGDALYVGVRMFDPHPDSIAAPLARRDASGIYSDWVHVIIDSRMDRRTAFRFAVNPRGVQKDVYHFDDGNEDLAWDAVWGAATAIDSLGWTAVFRIPLSQLRFATGERAPEGWGIGILRDVARRDERSTWSPWTRDTPGFVSSLGTLGGIATARAPRRFELLPYASSQLTRAPGEAGDPFHRANAVAGTAGADLKVGLPLGLTLAATINPDFGQVEVDPAQVNLTAFETFFEEKRPFFTEGADIFRFGRTRSFNSYGSQEYFYSRRVGRAPRRQLGGGDVAFVDAPAQTTILGAAKLSGKTAGGWSVGVLDAVTAREHARYADGEGARHTAPVEPLTNYTVGRVRRDLRGGQTALGALVTATRRNLSDPAFAPLLHERAYLAGLDFDHRWSGRIWSLSGYLAASHVAGDASALAATQRSSARYFQRPDAAHLDLDPARTSLMGHMGEVALARSGADGLDISLAYKEASPGFELNDAGFQGRTDFRAITTLVGRPINRPWWILRNHNTYAYTYHVWNFGGDHILDGYAAAANGTFNNLWSAAVRAQFRPGVKDDRLTRGGPLAATPAQWLLNADLSTDPRKTLSGGLSLGTMDDRSGARSRRIGLELDGRPNSALRLRAGPTLERLHQTRQYVTAGADETASATYGRRYIFADLDQTTLGIETRVDWTFTPRLSLQLFAQPYVSAGRYSGFKAFRAPGTYEFDVYGACPTGPASAGASSLCRDESGYLADADGAGPAPAIRFAAPDFTFRSLRGNAVLRWEYRPGSAIFLVWQQERARELALGDFDFGRDYGSLIRDPGRNTFLLKATYWFGG